MFRCSSFWWETVFFLCCRYSVLNCGYSKHVFYLPKIWVVNLNMDTGFARLEKYLNLKSLKIKSVLKSTGKSLKSLEKSLNSTIFCRTQHSSYES